MNSDKFLLDSGFFGWLYKILTPVEWLMTQIMVLFHKLLVLIGMPAEGVSWILAIVFLVLVVHACILPIFVRQMQSMRKMQALQPKMQHIQNKYKGKKDAASREAMSREMTKLYQDNGANPAGSCLPMLIQGPVFMCMFYTLSAIPYIASGIRKPLGAFTKEIAGNFSNTSFLGVKITTTFGLADTSGKIVIGIFVALMCAAMWFMQFNNMRKNLPRAQMEGSQYKMQQGMTWIFPIMYIFSGVTMPFAVLIYWLTNNIANMVRSMWQVYTFPTPGSPAAEEKEVRDHEHENVRRKRVGQISLEEEELERAKEVAEQREGQGFQRQQPKRKGRKK
ncbi:MAG: membrane protein insertase YidC [Bifidobacterium sp.]|jgi:YidC/Oxa1 family membrane protein insertase|nr:membrane protein insertase YidC [Bifidobacterium sp.]